MMDTKKMRAASHLLPDPGGEVVRECLDEIERLREQVRAREWQPIETAPRVPGVALLLLDEGEAKKGYFIEYVSICKLLVQRWEESGGWPISPTHWMPLPEPPVPPETDIAGTCTQCCCPVLHRPGKPGEFDHECISNAT